MKKITWLLLAVISVATMMVTGCASTGGGEEPATFTVTEQRNVLKSDDPYWNDWAEENKNTEGEFVYYIYWIKTAPKQYKKFIDTDVWYYVSESGAGNQFLKSQLEVVEEKLNAKKFTTFYAAWYKGDRIKLDDPLGLEK